jgi:hypothetical protein
MYSTFTHLMNPSLPSSTQLQFHHSIIRSRFSSSQTSSIRQNGYMRLSYYFPMSFCAFHTTLAFSKSSIVRSQLQCQRDMISCSMYVEYHVMRLFLVPSTPLVYFSNMQTKTTTTVACHSIACYEVL